MQFDYAPPRDLRLFRTFLIFNTVYKYYNTIPAARRNLCRFPESTAASGPSFFNRIILSLSVVIAPFYLSSLSSSFFSPPPCSLRSSNLIVAIANLMVAVTTNVEGMVCRLVNLLADDLESKTRTSDRLFI